MVDISTVFSGETLKAADLQGREVTVTIATIKVRDFEDSGNKLIISFQGKKKTLVCNKTNANRIAHLYGNNTDAWLGQQIVLYTDLVDFQGRTVEAVRVRAPAVNVPPAPNPSAAGQTHYDPGPGLHVVDRGSYELSEARRPVASRTAQIAAQNDDPLAGETPF